jgi:hypothetical protein
MAAGRCTTFTMGMHGPSEVREIYLAFDPSI